MESTASEDSVGENLSFLQMVATLYCITTARDEVKPFLHMCVIRYNELLNVDFPLGKILNRVNGFQESLTSQYMYKWNLDWKSWQGHCVSPKRHITSLHNLRFLSLLEMHIWTNKYILASITVFEIVHFLLFIAQ